MDRPTRPGMRQGDPLPSSLPLVVYPEPSGLVFGTLRQCPNLGPIDIATQPDPSEIAPHPGVICACPRERCRACFPSGSTCFWHVPLCVAIVLCSVTLSVVSTTVLSVFTLRKHLCLVFLVTSLVLLLGIAPCHTASSSSGTLSSAPARRE